MQNDNVEVVEDSIEKALERYTVKEEELGLAGKAEIIDVIIVKNILDHFIPNWRERKDRYYKLRKLATEQQLDRNLNKIREYVDMQFKILREEIISAREFKDEFAAEAAEVRRIIEQDKIAMEKIRMRIKRSSRRKRNDDTGTD